MESVQDPLRFGTEEVDLEDEVPLQVEPPASLPAQQEPAPAPAPAAHPAAGDPLSPLLAPGLAPATVAARHSVVSPTSSEIEAAGEGDAALLRGTGGGAADAGTAARWAEITVTDPAKTVSDGLIPGLPSTHTEYLVSSVPAEGPRRRTEVRRRFSDFVSLDDLLSISLRGFILFPRPDKAPLGGAAHRDAFVEGRRADLERYLRRLAAHPAAGSSEELGAFLEAEGTLGGSVRWMALQPASRGGLLEGVARLPRQLLGGEGSVPSAAEAAAPVRATNDLLRRFREMGERVRQEYRPPPGAEGDEAMLRERRARLEEHQASLAAASAKAEALVREFEHTGAVVGDLGLSLIKLAKFEEDSAAATGPYTDVGAAARRAAADDRTVGLVGVRQCRLSRVATGQLVQALGPLHEELALAPAAVGALREREAALLTVQLVEEDIEKKQRELAALEASGARVLGGDPPKARRLAGVRNDLAALDAALAAARAEYARVAQRNKQDLARRSAEREAGLQALARGFAQTASLYEERGAQIWRSVAEEFGGQVELDRARRH